MPEMNGYETTRIIREEMKSNIPIIALTTSVFEATLRNAWRPV
jgi:CheY-like chemotaxis protein